LRFPWVNAALLALVAAQLATGYVGLVAGDERQRWILWAHGAGAYAATLALIWKGAVILDALRRRRADLARVAFLVLLALVLGTLGSGYLWSFAGRRLLGPYSLMTLHVGMAIGVLGLLLVHVSARRFVLRPNASRDRRAALRLAGLAIAGAVLWGAAGQITSRLGLAGAFRRFTGSYGTGSLTGEFPVVSWLFDHPPPVDLDSWRLAVEGAVERPMSMSYDDLRSLANDQATTVLDCTGGWYSEQRWRGVAIGRLLDLAGCLPSAQSVTVEAVSGYYRRFPLEVVRRHLLALEVAGSPLDHGHGYPARLVAPDRRGFEWVKWVGRIRVEETGEWLQPPVPLE
jgi:DMSO/TMAO reductase YedYZ molybdopterin-dependent catalytic subunit